MLKQNNLVGGILIGLILPAITAVIFELLLNRIWITAWRGTPYFVAAGINLLLMRYFAAKHQDKISQGIILITLMFIIAVYLLKVRA